jgi:uncharacterized RDD family membrane protein YckC
VIEMSFLGQIGEPTTPGYRKKRFAAFMIDMMIVLCLLLITYSITGRPDFPAVKAAMDAAQAGAEGPDNQVLGDVMFKLFDAAFWQSLLIWFIYEVVTQMIFSGATVGKRVMKMRIVSWDPNRKRLKHHLMMIVRSAAKFLSMYLFQGFPFLIASLTIFANKESRSGFDLAAKTIVEVQESHAQAAQAS